MKRILLPILLIGILLLTGCRGVLYVSESVLYEYRDVAEVIEALDKHALSNAFYPTKLTEEDGVIYDVEPGGYRLGIYVYRDPYSAQRKARIWESKDGLGYEKGNLTLHLYNTTDRAHLDRLLADLRD